MWGAIKPSNAMIIEIVEKVDPRSLEDILTFNGEVDEEDNLEDDAESLALAAGACAMKPLPKSKGERKATHPKPKT